MSPCLVQQLFRQKIGRELDPRLVEEVLFHFLRSRKDLPRELLLDIKLTRSLCSSLVAVERAQWEAVEKWSALTFSPRPKQPTLIKNISPFESGLIQSSILVSRAEVPPGKVSSTLRRKRHVSQWGTIDILNELRNLKLPFIGYFPSSNPQWDSEDHFENAYIYLKPTHSAAMRPQFRDSKDQSLDGIGFVNEFLEDALTKGKRLSWGGNPDINSHEKILSTYY